MISPRQLVELETSGEGPKLSLVVPREDPAAKNRPLLKRVHHAYGLAEAALRQQCSADEARFLLSPLDNLTDGGGAYWEQTDAALAIYANAERALLAPLLVEPLPRVAVDTRFHFGPLLDHLRSDADFWILVLADAGVRLLAANHQRVLELTADDLPRPLGERLPFAAGSDAPKRAPDVGASVALASVVGAMEEFLRSYQQPLVLVGPYALRRAYRERSRYPHVLYRGLESESPLEAASRLQRRALDLVNLHQERERRDTVGLVHDAVGTMLGETRVESAEEPARQGRVDAVVYVEPPAAEFGTPVPYAGPPSRRERLSRIVLHTRLHGGQAFAVPPGSVPGGGDFAARYRYLPADPAWSQRR